MGVVICLFCWVYVCGFVGIVLWLLGLPRLCFYLIWLLVCLIWLDCFGRLFSACTICFPGVVLMDFFLDLRLGGCKVVAWCLGFINLVWNWLCGFVELDVCVSGWLV